MTDSSRHCHQRPRPRGHTQLMVLQVGGTRDPYAPDASPCDVAAAANITPQLTELQIPERAHSLCGLGPVPNMAGQSRRS
ncbi:MAG: hypothetical protein ABGZ17_14205 [Planctomycetaceae bacterium]